MSPRIRAFIDLLVERWDAGVPWESLLDKRADLSQTGDFAR
ncbi:hypothetical protein AB4Z48_27875 [Cupriavidus sp. 2TAF22]